MANSDYIKKGGGSFATSLALDAPLDHFTTTIAYTRVRMARADGIRPGMAAMIGDEIMRVQTVGDMQIEVLRGCADTVPAPHPVDSMVWIFDASSVGSDRTERSAGEIAAVKVAPFTMGGGGLPSGSVSPLEVEFHWRVFRPYAPGRLRANDAPWTVAARLDDTTPALHLTWTHRDRVLQADQLIGHDADSIGPEPGTTYTLRVYDPITDQIARTEVGILGGDFLYRRAQAVHDMGHRSEVLTPEYTLTASRDGFESWQAYRGAFELVPATDLLEVQVMPFAQRVIEAPYALNVKVGVAPDGNHALAVAARPSDRMADFYQLFAGAEASDTGYPMSKVFTPWIVSDFRLPELETIINVRTSSLYDGVPLSGVQVGHMALIDDEIVQVERVDVGQVTVRRGCCDTIPAVHIAGSRVWFFEASSAFDKTERNDNDSVGYQLLPLSYGQPLALADMPMNYVLYQRRVELPYAPGRMVVNGRPWFEEAQAVAGAGVLISWARRNRVAQGSGVVAHADPDQMPETGQTTRVRFYYETPAAAEGAPAVEHLLREYDVAGIGFGYGYGDAIADGNTAGRALGICGTVVIYCRVYALRAGLASLQSYVIPIRVPSYPC